MPRLALIRCLAPGRFWHVVSRLRYSDLNRLNLSMAPPARNRHMRHSRLFQFTLAWLVAGSLMACESLPATRVVYQDQATSVQLRADPRAGSGHSHPAVMTSGRMAQILFGIRVKKRGDPIVSIVTGQPEDLQAFSNAEIATLAPALSRALAVAAPQEIVAFYRRYSDANLSLGVTSGGLFMEGHQLYFVLANFRNRPSDVQSQAIANEFDPVTDPLMSLRALSFAALFVPQEALLPSDVPLVWSYEDPGKFFVLDLDRLPPEPRASSPVPSR